MRLQRQQPRSCRRHQPLNGVPKHVKASLTTALVSPLSGNPSSERRFLLQEAARRLLSQPLQPLLQAFSTTPPPLPPLSLLSGKLLTNQSQPPPSQRRPPPPQPHHQRSSRLLQPSHPLRVTSNSSLNPLSRWVGVEKTVYQKVFMKSP